MSKTCNNLETDFAVKFLTLDFFVGWMVTPVELVFGSSSQLRAVAEVYAANGGEKKFIDDFIKAWVKVMQLDRFDIEKKPKIHSSSGMK